MMELQEMGLYDCFSDNHGFHSKIDRYGRQDNPIIVPNGSTSFIYQQVEGNETFNEVSLDIKIDKHPNPLENNEPNGCTNPKNTQDPSATTKIYSGSKTTEGNLADHIPSIRATITITNDKFLDIYNRLTRMFDVLSHIEKIQKKWMQEIKVDVTLATLTRNYKVKQNMSVIEELISIVTRLGNYDDEYFCNHPILDQIQQEIRVAHDAAENAYFCDHVTEKLKLEGYISSMLALLTEVVDSFSSFCSEYGGTTKLQFSQILEQTER